jgi:hypothetical protein
LLHLHLLQLLLLPLLLLQLPLLLQSLPRLLAAVHSVVGSVKAASCLRLGSQTVLLQAVRCLDAARSTTQNSSRFMDVSKTVS